MFKKLATSIGFLMASLGLALLPSTAEADVTVALSPSLFEFGVDPGASFAETIMVTNDGEDAAFISVEVGPYGDGGGGRPPPSRGSGPSQRSLSCSLAQTKR